MRVKRKDEEVERSMVFNHLFVGVPRTFGEYVHQLAGLYWQAGSYISNIHDSTGQYDLLDLVNRCQPVIVRIMQPSQPMQQVLITLQMKTRYMVGG